MLRAMDKAIQKENDIPQHHLFYFRRHLKRVHIPAPVSIQENTVIQLLLQYLAYCGLPYAHCAADYVQIF